MSPTVRLLTARHSSDLISTFYLSSWFSKTYSLCSLRIDRRVSQTCCTYKGVSITFLFENLNACKRSSMYFTFSRQLLPLFFIFRKLTKNYSLRCMTCFRRRKIASILRNTIQLTIASSPNDVITPENWSTFGFSSSSSQNKCPEISGLSIALLFKYPYFFSIVRKKNLLNSLTISCYSFLSYIS